MVADREFSDGAPNRSFTELLNQVSVHLGTDTQGNNIKPLRPPDSSFVILTTFSLFCWLLPCPPYVTICLKHCLGKDKLEQLLTLGQNVELLLVSPRAVLSTLALESSISIKFT